MPTAAPTLARPDVVTDGAKPTYRASRLLSSRDLTVEVMDPNDPGRYNTGVRFTPVAAVIRAVAGGREFLMHRAEHDPLTAVAGLFAEFDLVTPPPGFREAALGEPFVKVGVGALVKTDPDYRFYGQYPLYRRADTTVRWNRDSARFTQALRTTNGYGYRIRADMRVQGHSLVVSWSLTNTGARPFETQQYVHNCFAPDNAEVKPGAIVSFPFDFAARDLGAGQVQAGREIQFESALTKAVNIAVDFPAGYTGPNTVSVYSPAAGLRLDCATSIPLSRLALHAAPVYVCPEQFVVIRLRPGQIKTWARWYTFRSR